MMAPEAGVTRLRGESAQNEKGSAVDNSCSTQQPGRTLGVRKEPVQDRVDFVAHLLEGLVAVCDGEACGGGGHADRARRQHPLKTHVSAAVVLTTFKIVQK